ncbi:hypothetical protein [Aliivibrio fischeri]|uniref:hypothetical protein n=1 Tax=Aliivibrio fischeri TaxID=668 RepID=UPI0007C581A0|nr:hypothetical protein [Aliivibrio fischeri]MCE7556366.1 hypothetical protein [Aliivibrio fischeri]MCE7563069.1 hypothetical protein [Aliivibrio fischeri]MCE7571361.1 hypothetical protein [Aliivibrio fischeri]TGA68283.1 hypothetical protein VFES401_15505 [Aliivibrio fischeri]
MNNKELYLEAMEFILEGTALSTFGENKSDIAVYLVGLVVADQKEELEPEKMDALRMIIQMVDEAESQKMAL